MPEGQSKGNQGFDGNMESRESDKEQVQQEMDVEAAEVDS